MIWLQMFMASLCGVPAGFWLLAFAQERLRSQRPRPTQRELGECAYNVYRADSGLLMEPFEKLPPILQVAWISAGVEVARFDCVRCGRHINACLAASCLAWPKRYCGKHGRKDPRC